MRNPLLDKEFLVELDNQHNKEVFAKAIALDFNENPLEEVTGRITQGSVSIDGNSAVRRTCSLTMVASEMNIHDYYWGLKTKFRLEIGLRNTINPKYPDIIWFPEGVFLITSFNTSQSTSAYSISLQGKDKMCMLNGDLGGTITALSVDFGNYDIVSSDGTTTTKKYLLKDIITEAVHEYAKEPFQNIIVNDLDDYGVELLEYRGSDPMYLIVNNDADLIDQFTFDENQEGYFDYITEEPKLFTDEDFKFDQRIEIDMEHAQDPTYVKVKHGEEFDDTKYSIIKVERGDVIGYRPTDLTYAGDLISNVGESVTSMLDKIKSMLGEFEYFYNLEGQFVFQKKKTYVQTSWNNIVQNAASETYVENAANTSSITYYFENANIITSFSNAPNLTNLRNDYSIWGARQSVSGQEIPVHLRYAIDKKPEYYKTYDGDIYCSKKLDLTELKEEIREIVTSTVLKRIYDFKPTYGTIEGLEAPQQNEDGSWTPGWWDIRDWYEYYKTITLETPNGTMKWYSKNNLEGCVPVSTLQPLKDYGYSVPVANDQTYTWLLVIYSNKQVSIGHGSGNPIVSPQVTCHFYDAKINERGEAELIKTDIRKDFIYPYAGCNDQHTYLHFLKNDIEKNGSLVYFYNPDFYFADSYDELIEVELQKEIKQYEEENVNIVDWREIIYQMSQDYKKHMHDDDFYVTIAKNNERYYPTGYTGYEQYYTDMDGFWRQLYDPWIEPLEEDAVPDTSVLRYYTWDENTEKMIEHSFKDVVQFNVFDTSKRLFIKKGNNYYPLVYSDPKFGQLEKTIAELKATEKEDLAQLKIQKNKDIAENQSQKSEITKQYQSDVKAREQKLKDDIANEEAKVSNQTYYEHKTAMIMGSTKYDKPESYYYTKQADNTFDCHTIKDSSLIDSVDKTEYINVEGGTPQKVAVKLQVFPIGKEYYQYKGYVKTSNFKKGKGYYFKSANVSYFDEAIIYTEALKGNPSHEDQFYNEQFSIDENKIYYKPVESTAYEYTPLSKGQALTRGVSYFVKKDGYDHKYIPSIEFKNSETYYYIDLSTFPETYHLNSGNSFSAGRAYYIKENDGSYKYYGSVVLDEQYYTRQIKTSNVEYVETNIFSSGNTYYTLENGQYTKAFEIKKDEVYYVYEGFQLKMDLTKFDSTSIYYYIDNTEKKEIHVVPYFVAGYTMYQYQPVFPTGVNKYLVKQHNDFTKLDTMFLEEYVLTSYSDKYMYYEIDKEDYIPIEEDEVINPKKIYCQKDSRGVYIECPGIKEFVTGVQYYFKDIKYKPYTVYSFIDNPTNYYLRGDINLKTGWNYLITENPENINFWFDFLDTEGDLSQYSVHNVGARPKAENDKDVKAIYFRETPNIIFVDEVQFERVIISKYQFDHGVYYLYDEDTHKYVVAEEWDDTLTYYQNSKYSPVQVIEDTFDDGTYYTFDPDTNEYLVATEYIPDTIYFVNAIDEIKQLKTGYTYLQLPGSLESLFSISGQGKSAKDKLDNFLYNYSYCTESITINSLPIYYLEPNTRIFVRDDNSGICGEYIVTRITLPLTYNGTMNITATKAVENMF